MYFIRKSLPNSELHSCCSCYYCWTSCSHWKKRKQNVKFSSWKEKKKSHRRVNALEGKTLPLQQDWTHGEPPHTHGNNNHMQKPPPWWKGCTRGFLERMGISHGPSCLCRVPDLLHLGSTSSPPSTKDNTCSRYCSWCFHLLDLQLWTLRDPFPKRDNSSWLRPQKNAALRREQALQPHLLTTKLSPFKTFKLRYTSSKLASISSSITLER